MYYVAINKQPFLLTILPVFSPPLTQETEGKQTLSSCAREKLKKIEDTFRMV